MDQPNPPVHRIDASVWEGEGYRPLVSFDGWVVALMNWEARFDPSNAGVVERHNQTDEVFVLQRGRGFLFVDTGSGLQTVDMVPGVLYNVTQGTWHNVLGTRDAQWLIVESSGTDTGNSEYRKLTPAERSELQSKAPDWMRAA